MFRTAEARQAATFSGLVYTMALAVALALPHAGIAPLLTMVTPALSVALITLFGTRRGQRKALWRGIGMRRPGIRSWPAAFLLPMIFLTIAYGTAVLLRVATLRPTPPASALITTTVNFVIATALVTVMALGEEIGWRGYLLPRVQALVSKRRAAVTTGFIHGLFHLPLILLTTTYDGAGNRYIVAPVVVVTITAAGVFYAWLRDRSGSIWPVAIAHATVNNVFDLGASAVVTTSPAALAYIAGESGAATLLAVVGCAIILLTRPNIWQKISPVPRHDTPRVEHAL